MLRNLAAAGISIALCACVAPRGPGSASSEEFVIRTTVAGDVIEVAQGQRKVGSIRRFTETTGERRTLFVVQNVHGQDRGVIDKLGRAWRFRPHQEPLFLGTWSVEEGARHILALTQKPPSGP